MFVCAPPVGTVSVQSVAGERQRERLMTLSVGRTGLSRLQCPPYNRSGTLTPAQRRARVPYPAMTYRGDLQTHLLRHTLYLKHPERSDQSESHDIPQASIRSAIASICAGDRV